jgi:hypothetical protein
MSRIGRRRLATTLKGDETGVTIRSRISRDSSRTWILVLFKTAHNRSRDHMIEAVQVIPPTKGNAMPCELGQTFQDEFTGRLPLGFGLRETTPTHRRIEGSKGLGVGCADSAGVSHS